MEKQFKFNLFSTALNGISVAVYESPSSYTLIVEKDGVEFAEGRYMREFITKKYLGADSVHNYMTEKYLEDESDTQYNHARALSAVIDGMNRGGYEQPDFSENGE